MSKDGNDAFVAAAGEYVKPAVFFDDEALLVIHRVRFDERI